MKKKALSVILFIVSFIAVYMIICFAIPGMRIKLHAAPTEYFLASLCHMVFVKAIASLIAALIVGSLPIIIDKASRK